MIKFEQIGSGTPKDILVITDDSQAELADWEEMLTSNFEDSQAAEHLAAARSDDAGHTKFIIPAGEVGEIGDFNDDLADFLEECNRKAMEEAKASE